MKADIPRLLLASSGSGGGKTTLACALLLALKKRGLSPAAFKCGPDYIDPMFHSRVLGLKSRNLDIFLCGENTVKFLLAENAAGHDLALLEGVMGLYDGLGRSDYASSNHLARLTATPTVLVISPKGQSLSLAAQLHGFMSFMPNTISGFVLNQVSPSMYEFYKGIIEERLHLPVFGYLPPLPEAAFESRQLGLVPPQEAASLRHKLDILAEACLKSVDLAALIKLARQSAALDFEPQPVETVADITMAVAHDEAFCFYYEDNLELLRRMGARLKFFSPLRDSALPSGCNGLLIGGGYPYEHADILSRNSSMLKAVKAAVSAGMPVIAECGGYIYLCKSLTDRAGKKYPMAGCIDTDAHMAERLAPFGYIALRAEHDNWLCRKGASFNAHEFHYSYTDDNGSAFMAEKSTGKSWPCIHAQEPVFAGFPHLHWWGCPDMAAAFLRRCHSFKKENASG